MNQLKNLLFISCLLLGSINLIAQNKILKGTISSSTGDGAVSGATVTVKGTSNSVAADPDGSFSIPVTSSKITLVITSIGYTSKEQVVNANQNNISVSLETDQTTMSEVVVVGYGTQKKSDLTGAISSIKGSDLSQLSTQRVDQAIQGRASGVYVLNTAGAPGATTTIRVRGMNSINGGNNALIVVDGLQG
ncbi:MAG: carboxypeptidase-like regulatory domain-containing protein, partial [Ginsengibacter sp.]